MYKAFETHCNHPNVKRIVSTSVETQCIGSKVYRLATCWEIYDKFTYKLLNWARVLQTIATKAMFTTLSAAEVYQVRQKYIKRGRGISLCIPLPLLCSRPMRALHYRQAFPRVVACTYISVYHVQSENVVAFYFVQKTLLCQGLYRV